MGGSAGDIAAFLGAYAPDVVREALRRYGLLRRGKIRSDWIDVEGEIPGDPRAVVPDDHEWRIVNGRMQIKHRGLTVGAAVSKAVRSPSKGQGESRLASRLVSCPTCRARMYSQSVCPNCAAGKAGMKRRWYCGENADHPLVYTDW